MKNLVAVILLLTPVIGICQQNRSAKKNSKPNDFMVIGYLQGRNIDTTSIPFNRLTHINFSFAIPAKNGGGLEALRNWDKLIGLVKKAHRHNVKVFISIGGWGIGDAPGDDSRFHKLAETREERNYFVENTMELVRKYNLDGVDMDWEYPDLENRSAEDNVLLMKQLADSLHAIKKELTTAVVHYGNQGE